MPDEANKVYTVYRDFSTHGKLVAVFNTEARAEVWIKNQPDPYNYVVEPMYRIRE
jgi:hypothetical protein